MTIFNNISYTFDRFKRDENGAFSMVWALSATVLLGAMGAALDYSLLTASYARAQSIADTTALSAAIYVKNNEIIPTDRNKGLIGDYTAQELGYKFRNWVINGSEGVTVNVAYDEVKREAIVTASGKTRPMLMQIFGHTELDFSSETVVKFFEKEPLDPASVVLVLDNSGSMFFDDVPEDEDGNTPPGTQRRIDGLTASANNFMDLLDETVGPQDGSSGDPRVLRTGMMAFSSDIIPSRTVPMKWGTIANSSINSMVPGGATNSAPPLVIADTWLNTNEPPIHEAENPGKTPLKYVILMTDGKNTVGTEEWVAREGTENWRAWVQTGTHMEFTNEYEVVNKFVPGGSCRWRGGFPRESYTYTFSSGRTKTWNTNWRVECKKQVEVPDYDWQYIVQEDEPTEPGDWEEGEFDISSNIATRAQCDALHADGVEVFSVAFALAPGAYRTNDWGMSVYGDPNATYTTTDEDANKARGILQYCASKGENFITADNTQALNAAFQRIGNTIVKEIIRIDS